MVMDGENPASKTAKPGSMARWQWFAAGAGAVLAVLLLVALFLAYRMPGLAGALLNLNYCG